MNPRNAPARPSSRSGFTLTHLVLTVVAVAVAATLAIPTFFDRPTVTLENAALLLAKDLRSAQNRAAYLDRHVRVHFDADGGGYRIEDGLHGPAAPHLERRYDRDAVFRGVHVVGADLGGSTFEFGPMGTPERAARIELGYKRERRVVVVERGTGKLHIEGSTSGFADEGY